MNRKPNILVVGSFMMDLIASAPRVPNLGETVIGTSFQTAGGGKGINQAVQCARLGANVTMAGCVVSDGFGKEMTDIARSAGVDISHVKVSNKSSSGVGNIQLQVTGSDVQNRIIVIPGANYDLEIEDLSWLPDEIRNFDMVMLQLELKMEITEYVVKVAAEAGVPVMLNPAPAAELSDEILSNVTYLSPNEFEAALLTDASILAVYEGVDEDALIKVASILRKKGVKKVIVTLGSNGSALADDDGIHRIEPVKMDDVKDPTAAGDSFVAAFCFAVTSGLSEADALRFASYTAAITVTRMGAMPSLPNINEVLDLMKERGFTDIDTSLFN